MAKNKKRKKSKKSRKKTRKSRKKTRKSRKAKKRYKKTKKIKRRSKKVSKRRSKKRRQSLKTLSQSKDSDGNTIVKVSDNWANQAYVNESKYKKKYKLSIKENEKFWAKEGKRISWIKKYTKIKDVKYSKEEVRIKWYYDGTLNASANCIDCHLKECQKLRLFG